MAGIPSVQRCAGCHQTVLSERPEIVKVLEYWDNKEPIPWVRVHDLPDHVRFSHKPHIRAGVTVWRSPYGMEHRLNLSFTNLTNVLYAEFSNAGFFRPEPKRNLTLAWQVDF